MNCIFTFLTQYSKVWMHQSIWDGLNFLLWKPYPEEVWETSSLLLLSVPFSVSSLCTGAELTLIYMYFGKTKTIGVRFMVLPVETQRCTDDVHSIQSNLWCTVENQSRNVRGDNTHRSLLRFKPGTLHCVVSILDHHIIRAPYCLH